MEIFIHQERTTSTSGVKEIKFLPQTRNGKTVLVSRVVKSNKAFPSYCESKELLKCQQDQQESNFDTKPM